MPPSPPADAPPTADAVVAGAGAVGLALAVALARAGVETILVGAPEARPNGRTVALLEGSVAFLSRLGLWERLRPHAEPLRVMRLVDDTGSLFRGPPLSFEAREIGRDSFGHNVENHVLVGALAEAARGVPGLRLLPGRLDDVVLAPGRALVRGPDGLAAAGAVLLAADGRRSLARRAAGIGARETPYPQHALTAVLHHGRPHRGVSTEFHTREGPFTLVPLPAAEGAPHRSSLVWAMRPEAAERRAALAPERLAREVERQSRSILGAVAVAGPVGRFPVSALEADRLTGPRLALVGESAHAMAPIGAQGLNLSLRDADALAAVMADAKRARADLGSPAVLERYGRMRRRDIAVRGFGVDLLNRSLLGGGAAMDFARGAGLLALAGLGPLRRLAMREGLAPGAGRATPTRSRG